MNILNLLKNMSLNKKEATRLGLPIFLFKPELVCL